MVRHERLRYSSPVGLDRSPPRQTSTGHSPLEALVEKSGACDTGREGAGLQERLQAKLRAAADRRHDGRPKGSGAAAEGNRSGASPALIVMLVLTLAVGRWPLVGPTLSRAPELSER